MDCLRRMLEAPQLAHMFGHIDEGMDGACFVGFVQFSVVMSHRRFVEFIDHRPKVNFRWCRNPLEDLTFVKKAVLKGTKDRLTFEAGDTRRFSCSELRAGTQRQRCFLRWWRECTVAKVGKSCSDQTDRTKCEGGKINLAGRRASKLRSHLARC